MRNRYPNQPDPARQAREKTGMDGLILRSQARALRAARTPEGARLADLLEEIAIRLDARRACMLDPAEVEALRQNAQQSAAQADAWRGLLWKTMQDARALAQVCLARQEPCRRALGDWLPLQLLLGDLHAGGDGGGQAAALRGKLVRALSAAPDTPPAAPAAPPADGWPLRAAEGEVHSLCTDLRQAISPPLDWRALAGRLLLALDTPDEPALTQALSAFGILPLYYEQAPEALRVRFSVFESGGSYPGLFRRDGQALLCLAGGGHLAGRKGEKE